jgi:thiamine biosynthesis protein ThiS
MVIFLNGEKCDVRAATISELIAELELPAQASLVEHNGLALRREEWDHALAAEDRVEIIRIVAGG